VKPAPVNPETMKLFLILLLLSTSLICFSQEKNIPILERDVTVSAANEPLENVLNEMSLQGNFVFSYSPEAINHRRNVNVNIRNKSVRYTLNQLFKDENIEFKQKGKYVILRKKATQKEEVKIFEGYVYDSQTGKKLTEASVYDKSLLASAVTDKYGYFSMELPADAPIQSLQVSKVGYSDTLLVSLDSAGRYKNIEISLNEDEDKKPVVDLHKITRTLFVPEKIKINARNITDPIFRSVQFSLIPTVSTNRFLGGAAINDVSFNVTVGYVQGIRKFEAGGVINYVLNNVKGFQAAGVGNIVGGNVTGFQSAGVFNIVNKVKGFQAAGVFNQATTVHGSQAAGVFNLVRDTANVQMAGVFNVATKNAVQISGVFNKSTSSNVQIAGVANSTNDAAMQISGVLNETTSLDGSQIAGAINTSRSNSKLQIAGAINHTRHDAGIQISGLANFAGKITGLQLAPFNFADSATGVPIGLFSFVKKGYHKIEVSADETFPLNLAFRTGTKKFHTFLTAGTSSLNMDKFLWNVGYGLGTSFGNQSKLLFDIDFSSSEVFYGNNVTGNYHWYKIYMGLDKKISRKMSIIAGVSYNALLSDSFQDDYDELNSRMPFYHLTNYNFPNGHNLKTWIGAKIGIRFF
jgi:hypothetical protein